MWLSVVHSTLLVCTLHCWALKTVRGYAEIGMLLVDVTHTIIG